MADDSAASSALDATSADGRSKRRLHLLSMRLPSEPTTEHRSEKRLCDGRAVKRRSDLSAGKHLTQGIQTQHARLSFVIAVTRLLVPPTLSSGRHWGARRGTTSQSGSSRSPGRRFDVRLGIATPHGS